MIFTWGGRDHDQKAAFAPTLFDHARYRRRDEKRKRERCRVDATKKDPMKGSFVICAMERVMGIEPTLLAWKAKVLPLNYTRE
jgi:hypothetical protein